MCLFVGKTGYYCLLDSMELLLSLWLNKVSKARPFADSPTSIREFSKKSPLRSQLICDSREALCICEWGVVIVFVKENHKIQDKTQSIWIHLNVVTSFSSTLTCYITKNTQDIEK